MSRTTRGARDRRHAATRAAGQYLMLWLAVLVISYFAGDTLLTRAVEGTAGVPAPVLVLASWLPLGGLLMLASVSVAVGGRSAREATRPVRLAAAALALAMACQVPVVVGGRTASDARELALATVSGRALEMGTYLGYGAVLVAAGLLFGGSRLLVGLGMRRTEPGERTVIYTCTAAALAGLAAALVIVSSS